MNKRIAPFMLMVAGLVVQNAGAQIVITSISASDPSSLILDVDIGSSGTASTAALDFIAVGSTAKSGAFGGKIGIFLDAMDVADSNPPSLGNKLDDGVFNRASTGEIGVNGLPNGGINNQEGIVFFLDELTGIDPSLAVQLTGITLRFMGAGEICMVMNPRTRQVQSFTGDGNKDVSGLDLWVRGGGSGALATLIADIDTSVGGNNFRMVGFTLEVVDLPAPRPKIVVASSGAADSPGSAIDFDLVLDGAGVPSVTNGDFSVSGFTSNSNAFNGAVSVTLDAIKNVSTAAETLGEKLVDGIVNRDSTSAMGVEGDPGGNGLAYVGSGDREGLSISFDKMDGIDPETRIQITRIGVIWLRRDESCTVVNLGTGASREYWGTIPTLTYGDPSQPVDIDVSDLNLGCWGGETGKVATIFAQSDNANFRVKTITFEMKQGGEMTVFSTSSKEPGSTLGVDVLVGGAGGAATTNIGMMAQGYSSQGGAFGGTIGLIFDAAKNISTDSATLGDKLLDGNISRNSSGQIGVDGDPGGGGIGRDGANTEGLMFVFDRFDGIDPSLQVKLTKVKIGYLNSGESFSVVNLATRNYLEFSGSAGTYPENEFNVSSLGIKVAVGSSAPAASLFAGDGSSFVVISATLELVGAGGLQMEATISVVDADTVQLVWESVPGASYKVSHTPDLATIPFEDLAGHVGIPSGGASTTNQVDISSGSQDFYKVISE